MGLIKKIFRPVRKIAKKIIPKEIRPALPFLAAYYGPAAFAKEGIFSNKILTDALLAAGTAAATDEDANLARVAALAAAPEALSQGLGTVSQKFGPTQAVDFADELTFAQKIGEGAQRGKAMIQGAGALKTIGAQTAIDQSAKFAEIRQDEIDEYNRSLREQGVLDKTKRRTAIFNIYKNAGYDDDYVNSMLDRYGYNEGGIVEQYKKALRALKAKMRAPETVARTSAKLRRKLKEDDDNDDMIIPPKKPEKDENEEPIPVRDVSKDDLAGGLMAAAQGVEKAFGTPFGGIAPAEFKRFAQGGEVEEEGIMSKIADSMGRDYDYFTRIKIRENLKQGETMEDAADLAEQEAMDMVMDKYTKGGFARGGEVEIEEETDDLGIMDFMKDQGVPFGEQASDINNDRILEQLFEEFLDMGLSPEDAAKAAREAFDRMSSKPREGIMQMAKSDIEEMYEQYVFEMEEMGLEPMSFSQFLARERAGMKNGGNVQRRKKGEPMDDDDKKPGPSLFPKVPKGNFFLDKMPKPKKMDGIMEAADGGIMEKDMRGGGFIPEGSKERADDVPARLSKNEFVMTADAVRAAGGGSVNKGAKRMYDMMYSLEGKI